MRNRGPKDEYRRLDKKRFVLLAIGIAVIGFVLAELLNAAVRVFFGW